MNAISYIGDILAAFKGAYTDDPEEWLSPAALNRAGVKVLVGALLSAPGAPLRPCAPAVAKRSSSSTDSGGSGGRGSVSGEYGVSSGGSGEKGGR